MVKPFIALGGKAMFPLIMYRARRFDTSPKNPSNLKIWGKRPQVRSTPTISIAYPNRLLFKPSPPINYAEIDRPGYKKFFKAKTDFPNLRKENFFVIYKNKININYNM